MIEAHAFACVDNMVVFALNSLLSLTAHLFSKPFLQLLIDVRCALG